MVNGCISRLSKNGKKYGGGAPWGKKIFFFWKIFDALDSGHDIVVKTTKSFWGSFFLGTPPGCPRPLPGGSGDLEKFQKMVKIFFVFSFFIGVFG